MNRKSRLALDGLMASKGFERYEKYFRKFDKGMTILVKGIEGAAILAVLGTLVWFFASYYLFAP